MRNAVFQEQGKTNVLTPDTRWPNFSERDLDFVVSVVAPAATDSNGLKRLIVEDPKFRSATIGDDRLFDRVLNDEEVLLHISPAPLLRGAAPPLVSRDRDRRLHRGRPGGQGIYSRVRHPRGAEVHEAARRGRVPRVDDGVVHSHPELRRSGQGTQGNPQAGSVQRHECGQPRAIRSRRKSRGSVSANYKRIADVCLFLSGVFPNSAPPKPSGGESAGTVRAWRMRRSMEEFERDGRRFYGLAGGHPAARALELSSVFATLKENFTSARKPLTFVSTRFLHARGRELFGMAAS